MRTALLAVLFATAALADEQVLSSAYWPRSLELKLAPAPLKGAVQFSLGTRQRGDPFPPGAPRPPGVVPRPAASAAPPDPRAAAAAATRRAETARAMDRDMAQVNRSIIDMATSASDLVRITMSRERRELLRPLLLFLAEHGVLKPTEVDSWMAADDVQPLLDRVKLAVEHLHDRRDALEVRRYLLENN